MVRSMGLEFPGSPVVKNPLANARDMGSIPGPRGSHMLQSNEAHVPQQLSLCPRAWDLQLLRPACSRICAQQQEKPLERKPANIKEDPGQSKKKKKKKRHELSFQRNMGSNPGFPGGSDGKASACNAGNLGSVPGSRRSPGEGNGNPPHILAWKIPWTEEPGRL